MTPEELVSDFDAFVVIDVRDEDFTGKKIRNAINIPSTSHNMKEKLVKYRNKKIVFHCQYSQTRGPKIAKKFGGYLLEGGFKRFAEMYPEYLEEIE